MLQGSPHVGYDATHGGMTGAGGAHVIPGTLTQYVGRHYATQPVPAHGYSIPASTWVPQYVMQPAPAHHMTQIEVINAHVPVVYPKISYLAYRSP